MSTITLSSTGQHWTAPPGFADAPLGPCQEDGLHQFGQSDGSVHGRECHSTT